MVRAWQPAAEAKKAEGASWTSLRTPIPPEDTGREAWSHVISSDKLTLRTSLVIEWRILSIQSAWWNGSMERFSVNIGS